jgi:hexosaminidase
VVPEIELPGHARAALAAYPQLSCTGIEQPVATGWGVFDDVYCAGNDSVFTFLEGVLDEVLALFPGEYIHIGGDECPKTRWHDCAKCQARIATEGLADEHALQSYFIRRIEGYLNARGRQIIGWDEILEGGLAPNATVMSWRGEAGGIAAAKSGHDAIMTPGTPCYWDHYQSKDPGEPHAIGGFNPVESVFLYNPVPAELTADEAKRILGAQANLWTEYVLTPAHAEYMILPRQLALAEVLWTGPRRSEDLPEFRIRATQRSKVLKSRGFHVAPHFLIPESKSFRRNEAK